MSLRLKLERLMFFRVLMVTLLLGSAVVVNVNDSSSFYDPTYLTIFGLIVCTYTATIIYAALVRRLKEVKTLAYVQLFGDILLASGLVYVTGGTQSIFAFMMYLSIINGAILMGRVAGLVTATMCSASFVLMLLVRLEYLPDMVPSFEFVGGGGQSPIYSVFVNIAAFYLVGILAGYLAKRLEEQGSELERKQLDIRELQALNQNILSSIGSGVVTLDSSLRVLFINRASEEMLALQMSKCYGEPVVEVIPELEEAIGQIIRAEAQSEEGTGALWEGWVSPSGAEEPIFVSISHSRLLDGQSSHYGHILVVQDLTMIRRLRQHFQRQERLAAVGQLAAAIAHEIRNPLASISGSVEMLKMFVETGPDEERLMNIVIREIDRLNGLIGDFLEYTRSRRRSRVNISLFEIISETAEMFNMDRKLVGEIELEMDIDACQRRDLLADVEGMRQVFWNLLRNAAQAMEGTGKIRIVVEALSGRPMIDGSWDGAKLATSADQTDGFRIRVSDTGPGIPEDLKDRIFEPFFTTKKEGTGLGLATIYRIVEDHDGTINVETSPQGTTFIIDLPVKQQFLGVNLPAESLDGVSGGLITPDTRLVDPELDDLPGFQWK